jgi:hypothetical protein
MRVLLRERVRMRVRSASHRRAAPSLVGRRLARLQQRRAREREVAQHNGLQVAQPPLGARRAQKHGARKGAARERLGQVSKRERGRSLRLRFSVHACARASASACASASARARGRAYARSARRASPHGARRRSAARRPRPLRRARHSHIGVGQHVKGERRLRRRAAGRENATGGPARRRERVAGVARRRHAA